MSKKSKAKQQKRNQENLAKVIFLQKALEAAANHKQNRAEAVNDAPQRNSHQDDVLLTLIKSYFDFNTKSVEKGVSLLSELIGLFKAAIDVSTQAEVQSASARQTIEKLSVEKDFEKEMTKIKNAHKLEKIKIHNANHIPKSDLDKAHTSYKHECNESKDTTEQEATKTSKGVKQSKVENIYENENYTDPTLHFAQPTESKDNDSNSFLHTQKIETSVKDSLSKIRKKVKSK